MKKKWLLGGALALLLALAACGAGEAASESGITPLDAQSAESAASLVPPPEQPAGSGTAEAPPFQSEEAAPQPYDLDWTALNSAWQEEMGSGDGLRFTAETNGPVVTLLAVANKDLTGAEAGDLAEEMLRLYSDLAAEQDGRIEPSGQNYYGGLYDEYAVVVGVAKSGTEDDPEAWLLHEVVDRGSHEARSQVAPASGS